MLCNFSVRMLKYIFLKILNFFLPTKKLKKTPRKFAYLCQLGGFFLCSPDCTKKPRTSFSFYKLFYTTISCRISVWHPTFFKLWQPIKICVYFTGYPSKSWCKLKGWKMLLQKDIGPIVMCLTDGGPEGFCPSTAPFAAAPWAPPDAVLQEKKRKKIWKKNLNSSAHHIYLNTG